MDWCFEVERFINIAFDFSDVYKLGFVQALVNPSVTNWLNLCLSSRIFFQPLNHFSCFEGIFHHIEAVSFLNLCSACIDVASIFYNLIGQIAQLDLFFLCAVNIKAVILKNRALKFFDYSDLFLL